MPEIEFSGKLDAKRILGLLNSDKPLAETLSAEKITKIQSDCQELYEKDAQSCQAWRDDAKRLLEKAKLKDKTRAAYIRPWQADIQMPDIMFAAMQFNARTFPEYVKDGKVCEAKINGKIDDKKQQRADRVCDYINWQLTQQITEWEENFDKLLIILPIIGHCFKMTAYDEQLGRITDFLLMPDMVTVDNTPNNPDWMRRISIDMTVNQNVLASRIAAGVWRNIEITPSSDTTSDKRYSIVQMHCWLDLDDDDYEEPYIVTFEKESWSLLSVVPRFDVNSLRWLYDPKNPADRTLVGIEAVEYVTSYTYYPAPDGSALGIGIGHLIEKPVAARNTAINQIQDAGTRINLSSGLIRSGLFRDDGVIDFDPGEFKIIDAAFGADDMSKAMFPLPVNQPAAATFEVFQTMGDTINRIAQTGEIMSGEGVPANMPATSVLAIIEQGKVGQRVVLKRINQSLTRELRLIYRLNRAYLQDAEYQRVLDESCSVKDDFDGEDLDISPVADPMFSTRVERLMRAQAAMQAGIQSPLLMKSYLIELGYSDDEAMQLAQGDQQMKVQAQAAQQQAALMDKQKDILTQQERAAKAAADAARARSEELKLQLQLEETRSKILVNRATAIKTMVEAESVQSSTQIEQTNAELEALANLPPAFPTDEELNNAEPAEAGEGIAGGVQPVGTESSDQSLPGMPEQSGQQPQPTDITQPADNAGAGSGAPHPSPSAVADGGIGGSEGSDLQPEQ